MTVKINQVVPESFISRKAERALKVPTCLDTVVIPAGGENGSFYNTGCKILGIKLFPYKTRQPPCCNLNRLPH